MKMSRQLTKQRIPLRQEDLRNGLIQIFLFERWTEFLAQYSGSYGVRPRPGWDGGGGQSGLWEWMTGNHRSLAKLPGTTEFHHLPILPIVYISYLNSKSFAYDPSSWKHSKMRMCHYMPAIVLFKVLYYKIKNVFLFFVCLFLYYLCEKCYKPIISSVAQSCPTLCDPMDCSIPGLSVHHQLLEFTQTHVYWVGDAIQPSHPLSSPSPPAFNLSQHQDFFKWVSSSYQVAKILEFQLQHQSFQWIFRTDFL